MSLSKDLEAEIRDLAARRDIHEAIYSYMRGQDRLMPEVQRSAFHDDGDVADGEVYFFAHHRIVEDGEDKDMIVAGRYIDRYENRNGAWKITKRRELVDWARTDPVADDFLRENPAVRRGARGQEDFSNTRNWPEVQARA